MSAADAYPHATDLALVPFQFDADRARARFTLTPDLARHDGVLYGGTGAAAAVMAMEAVTQRPALWVATQFVAYAQLGEVIELEAQTLASGKRIAQVQVVARVDERVIFTALGATADPRPNGLTGQYEQMPRVTAPDHSPPLHGGPPASDAREVGFSRNLEFREALLDEPHQREMALWARLTPPRPELTPAGVAYLADMVPGAVARAAGKLGGGFSLDNALRFTEVRPAEWVLLHLRGDAATHGYGHGSFTAWSRDGVLLATGSQTASMVHVWDGPDDPALVEWRKRIANEAAAASLSAQREGEHSD
jgi:acyl-CoA thioesterase